MTNSLLFETQASHADRFCLWKSGAGRLSLGSILLFGIAFGLFGLAFGIAGPVSAQTLEPVQVYATWTSADTGPGGPLGIPATAQGPDPTLFLWATGGSTQGVSADVCTKLGTGDALCGISFTLTASDGYQLAIFEPNPSFDSSGARLPFRAMLASDDTLVANAFDLGTATTANRYLGSLELKANGATGDSQIVVSGSAIGADLNMRTIASEAIVVPEPQATLMLAFGVLSLLGLGSSARQSRPR